MTIQTIRGETRRVSLLVVLLVACGREASVTSKEGAPTPAPAAAAAPSAPPEPGNPTAEHPSQRDSLLARLHRELSCPPQSSAPTGLCIVAAGFPAGTAGDIAEGVHVGIGISHRLSSGEPETLTRGEPVLTALALRRGADGIWGAVSDIGPQSPEEEEQNRAVIRRIEAILNGEPTSLSLPQAFAQLLQAWAPSANHPMRRGDDGWSFSGAPGELRQVGSYWVLVGEPKEGPGIMCSVFLPLP